MVRTVFRSLSVRNYRLFAAGQVVSVTGTWMQRVAQDWLVLELSDNSGTALGIVTGLQFLPMLLFGLYGGVLADRFDKRVLLIVAQSAMGLLALVLGLLDVTGVVTLGHVYVLAALLGLASVLDVPVRQSFVMEIVGPDHLPNAVSLNSAIFNTGRVIGPAVAGVLIALTGTGTVFLLNAVSYLAVIAGLLAMRVRELARTPPLPRSPGQMREGLRYVVARPELLLPIVLVLIIGTFGLNFQLSLALVAKEVFHRDASAFGLLSSMLAAGSLLGALVSSARTRAPSRRTLLVAAVSFGVLEVVTGLMPTFLTFALLLLPTGLAVLLFTTAANASVQLASDDAMRGRVMALYTLVFLGGTPLGSPLIGVLADHLGPRSSLLLGGSACVVGTLIAAALLGRRASRQRTPGHLASQPQVSVAVGTTRS